MAMEVSRTLNSYGEIRDAHNDSIRMLKVAQATSPTPLDEFAAPPRWLPTTADTVSDFSAACYYFARELQKTEHVPLGLINSSWGGSSIQPWMSKSALRAIGGYDAKLIVLHEFATNPQLASDHWGSLWQGWWRDKMHSEPWNAAVPDASRWRTAPSPLTYWELWGVPELANFDGLVWYRTTVSLTAAQAKQSATLGLGTVDQIDATWLNGHWLGTTSGANKERTYTVPPKTLKKGVNTIAVNVLDTYGFGGIYGPAEKRALHLADGTLVPLDQEWRYQIVPPSIGPPIRSPWEDIAGVTLIRNAMIAPLASYGLRGVLWYQGESNAEDAGHYQALLEGLMADWRTQFGNDLPFLIVQLANYGPAATAPGASNWASLREAQRLAVAKDAHAGLAMAIDIGERTDIHPTNKQELGRRLARAARHVVYGEQIAPSGPVPVEAHRDGGRVIVSFKDVDGSLVAYGAYRPVGFELCATDQSSCRFVDASLAADRVVLEPAGGAPTPTRVRFCWADSPVCTLYDKAGQPAGPFEMRIN
jgi:sialate O-acetylesterase